MANSSDSSNSNHSTRTMLNSGALSSVHQRCASAYMRLIAKVPTCLAAIVSFFFHSVIMISNHADVDPCRTFHFELTVSCGE